MMADPNWRTNPDIQLAKQVCQRKQAAGVVIVWFMPNADYGVASYGRTGAICKAVGGIADDISRKINNYVIDTESLNGVLS